MFFELFDEDTAGVRPGVLAEPRPQERVQRHTMEHIVDFVCCAPMVQILDAPVPQPVEQLCSGSSTGSRLFPSRLSKCPSFFLRTSPCALLCAIQLVEVPTIVSYSFSQRIMEQIVGVPVPGGGGRIAGLQGFPPEQSSTALQQRRVRF